MTRWLAASIAIFLGATPWLSLRAADLLVYRCTSADGAVSLQDTSCPHEQAQETRTLARPVDVPQPPAPPPSPAVPPPAPVPAPSEIRVTLVTPQPLYDCQRHDGSSYESDSGVPERRWVPLWVRGMDPRAPPRMFGQVGGPRPSPPTSGPGLGTVSTKPGVAYGAGGWVVDRCYRLPAAVACERRRERLKELGHRFFNAGQGERDRLRIEQRGLREQLRQECGFE